MRIDIEKKFRVLEKKKNGGELIKIDILKERELIRKGWSINDEIISKGSGSKEGKRREKGKRNRSKKDKNFC